VSDIQIKHLKRAEQHEKKQHAKKQQEKN